MDTKDRQKLQRRLIDSNYVNHEDIMNKSFETTRLLFEQNEKDEHYMLRWCFTMKQESPSIYNKFMSPKRIQHFLTEECNAEEIQSCKQMAQNCIIKQNALSMKLSQCNNKPTSSSILLSSPTQILIQILKFAAPTKKYSNVSIIPYQNLEFVCRTFWQIVRNNLYRDLFIELMADQPMQVKAVLQQWKYKNAKRIIIRNGLNKFDGIIKFRDSWQCLKTLSIDIGQISGINHLISVEDLTINSHINCLKNLNHLKLIGLDQYFDTRNIEKLTINGALLRDKHIHEVLNYDYNNLLALDINDWNPNNCAKSIIHDIPLEFKLSKMKTPNLMNITFTDKRPQKAKHIDEYLHFGEIWITNINKICTTALNNNNNNDNNSKKLYLKYHYDTFCKSIQKNIKTNKKFAIINDYKMVYIKPPPALKYKTTLYRDSDVLQIGSGTSRFMKIYNEVSWKIKIQNIDNNPDANPWTIGIGISGDEECIDFNSAAMSKLQFQGPQRDTIIKQGIYTQRRLTTQSIRDQYARMKLKSNDNEIIMKYINDRLVFTINGQECPTAIHYYYRNKFPVKVGATVTIKTSYYDMNENVTIPQCTIQQFWRWRWRHHYAGGEDESDDESEDESDESEDESEDDSDY